MLLGGYIWTDLNVLTVGSVFDGVEIFYWPDGKRLGLCENRYIRNTDGEIYYRLYGPALILMYGEYWLESGLYYKLFKAFYDPVTCIVNGVSERGDLLDDPLIFLDEYSGDNKVLLLRPHHPPMVISIRLTLDALHDFVGSDCKRMQLSGDTHIYYDIIGPDVGDRIGCEIERNRILVGKNNKILYELFGPAIICNFDGKNVQSLTDEQLDEYWDKFYTILVHMLD